MPLRPAMFVRTFALVGALLFAAPGFAQVSGWVRLVRWMSGDSDRTTVPIMDMGPHMQMSLPREAAAGDRARADAIVAAARAVLRRFPDEAAVVAAGYRPFHETGRIGEEVHFTSVAAAYAEGKHVDYARPGSILLERTGRGLRPIGVMYSARGDATADDLDAIAPMSIAVWHRHVDFCFPDGPGARDLDGDPRFGYDGTLHTEEACRAAGGYWVPLAFGWMTHVYPDRRDGTWGGEGMSMSQTGPR